MMLDIFPGMFHLRRAGCVRPSLLFPEIDSFHEFKKKKIENWSCLLPTYSGAWKKVKLLKIKNTLEGLEAKQFTLYPKRRLLKKNPIKDVTWFRDKATRNTLILEPFPFCFLLNKKRCIYALNTSINNCKKIGSFGC